MKLIVLLGYLLVFLPSALSPSIGLAQSQPEATRQIPVMLYVARTGCTFCYRFEEDILDPLIKSGVYTDKIIIRKLMLDSAEPVENFRGERVTPKELLSAYSVTVTPTLLFLDTHGNELVPRIVGYQKNDFYGQFLEQSINKANSVLVES